MRKSSKKGHEVAYEYFEWYGVLAILLAYGIVSFNVVIPDSLTYQLLNATGAVGIMAGAWHKKDYQPVVLNFVWLIIATFALIRVFLF